MTPDPCHDQVGDRSSTPGPHIHNYVGSCDDVEQLIVKLEYKVISSMKVSLVVMYTQVQAYGSGSKLSLRSVEYAN